MAERVLITGASRAIALELARLGHAVVINYRQRKDEKTLAAVHEAGGAASLLPFDVADRATCCELLEAEFVSCGPYYGIVCNAGVHDDDAFSGMFDEAWDHVLRTNLGGFYNVVRPLVMPIAPERRGGNIVIIASAAGMRGNRGQVNYSASNAGLIGAARSLALGPAKRKITVNSVVPGLIETEMTEGLPVAEMAELIPVQRMGTPEEVASVVGFLFSAAASYATEQVISVNGGLG